MSPARRQPRILRIMILQLVVPFVAFFLLKQCGPTHDMALERARACPRAVELLGADFEPAFWPGCGSMERSGAREETSWSFPVEGSAGSGTIRYQYFRGGAMSSFSGELKVGEEVVNLGQCGAPAPVSTPTPPPAPAPAVRQLIVTGPLEAEQVAAIVERAAGALSNCAGGRELVLQLTIGADGRVENQQLASGAVDAAVEACLQAAIGRLRFPPEETTSTVFLPIRSL